MEEGSSEAQTFLYETLCPLSYSNTITTAFKSPPSDDTEPYSVFRNQISLSVLNPDSREIAAPDFFSLDVAEPIAAPTPAREPKTPAREAATPRLENGWFRGNCRLQSPMLQLHKEIVDFCDFLSPTLEEKAARDKAVESVFDVIKHIWPHSKVEVFGSFKTGLYLPTSDIDVVILGSGLENTQKGLVALSRALSQRGVAKNIQVIGKARVPIIKFIEKKSGVAFDISFDAQNGPKAAEFIQDAVSHWPPLRPLCLILKVFLQQRELNESIENIFRLSFVPLPLPILCAATTTIIIIVTTTTIGTTLAATVTTTTAKLICPPTPPSLPALPPLQPPPPLPPLCLHDMLMIFCAWQTTKNVYSGGIGSYALLAMLMAMLQSLPECQTSSEQNLGVLLVHFLDFYGRKLNTSDVGVSCKGAGSFFLKSSKGFANKGRPFLIAIEDPQAPENDIGKNSFNYFQIRSAFSMAFSTLTNPKTIMALGPNRSILGTIIRPDPILLERKGGSNGDVTFNSLLPGAGEPLQHQYGEQQGILCNWQLGDEEEPLPRGNSTAGESTHSSGKKRKASLKEKSTKKVKENGVRHEENGSRKEKGVKKQRWRHNRDSSSHNSNRRSPNGFVHYVAGSPWNR
uniref:polynucleotide adenylyltransferase n=1 Tax=Fagus sylvatica TaxID=28930 RepID=A0A2N9H0I2_FAGSY